MAIDKAITDLPVATEIGDEDYLVLQQNNVAKSVRGAIVKKYAGDVFNDAKDALLALLSKVAYIDENGQQYLDNLEAALMTKNVLSITAVFDPGQTVIYTDDTLDDLKQYLTVTANYDDGTSGVVTTYTLSGTLTAGTSTITVTYADKTTTFDVEGVVAPLYSIPDFAEQTGTASGTYAVSKTNGYYSVSGTFGATVYISPSGVVSTDRTTSTWFAIQSGASVVAEIKDITWNNPGTAEVQLQAKMQRSDATGNLFQASFAMAANSSGTNGDTSATNVAGGIRNMSGIVLQAQNTSGSSRNFSVSATFKLRYFVDGVRYL